MTGLDELVALRKSGRAPAAGVLWHLTDQPMPPADEMAPVYLRADVGERFERMDLRALVGLRVTVHGPYLAGNRVQAAALAAMKAGASSVLGFASDRPKLEPENMVLASGDFSWLA
jgi:hypothetical protein